jgi:hypothetical protein
VRHEHSFSLFRLADAGSRTRTGLEYNAIATARDIFSRNDVTITISRRYNVLRTALSSRSKLRITVDLGQLEQGGLELAVFPRQRILQGLNPEAAGGEPLCISIAWWVELGRWPLLV